MNIVPLGFLDVSTFAASYVLKYRSRGNLIMLRDGDDEFKNTAVLTEWKQARALLTRIRNAAAAFVGGDPPDLGRVFLDTLTPGASAPWAIDDGDYRRAHHQIRICIIPSPGAWVYCGGEAAVLPWGQVTAVNVAALTTDVNFGPTARTNLIVDVARPES